MQNLIEPSYPVRFKMVADLMIAQGLTKPALAKLAKLNRSTIRRLFDGKNKSLTTIGRVAGALGVRTKSLIDGNDGQSETADYAALPTVDGANSRSHSTASVNLKQPIEYECFQIDVCLDLRYSSFNQREEIPRIFGEIRETIHQKGCFVVEYIGPSNSVRIIFLATLWQDVDRFFAAFFQGKFDSLRMMDARILTEHVEIEDDEDSHASDAGQSTAAPARPVRSPSSITEDQAKPLESFSAPEESESPRQMTAEQRSRVMGTVTGMAAGAAIGSVIPVIGTAIGGLIGGVFGGLFMKSRQKQSNSESDDEPRWRPPTAKH